jgi:phosphotransferase system HPr-like phosphotransfer protein
MTGRPGIEAPRPPPPEDEAAASRLDHVLREEDYRTRLSEELCDLLRLGLLLRQGVGTDLSRRFARRLAEEAERVEYGLLEVGARGNRTYAFLAEVVTAVRWLAKTVHALLHLRARIVRYLGARIDLDGFRRDLEECLEWLVGRVSALLDAAGGEVANLGVECPDSPFDSRRLDGTDARWRLPQDADAAETADERERIADLVTAFLALADDVERRVPAPSDSPEAVARTLEALPAAAAQEARVRMHAIQSTYDTVVAATPLEGADPELKVFRGYVSILLHLFEAVAYLAALLARLEEDARSAKATTRAAGIVEPADLRRRCAVFGIANTVACLREARPVAQSLLDRYARTREAWFDLPPGRKLHLRPAGLIVRVVQQHGMAVRMRMGEGEVDARQLMDVILLAAGNPEETRVGFRGDERTLLDLQRLFEARLAEDGFDRLPPELSYLLPKASPT